MRSTEFEQTMETSPLYPDCDFGIWFRSVSEGYTTEQPIQGKKTGKNYNNF